ncbi:unnamed protein product [Xylocopa violacea]|uniref:Uncharacterized protein n=1 Tax=Xylocopa violacea TaxID=135666 RepID=A0ABP1NX63_XYLVO
MVPASTIGVRRFPPSQEGCKWSCKSFKIQGEVQDEVQGEQCSSIQCLPTHLQYAFRYDFIDFDGCCSSKVQSTLEGVTSTAPPDGRTTVTCYLNFYLNSSDARGQPTNRRVDPGASPDPHSEQPSDSNARSYLVHRISSAVSTKTAFQRQLST